MRNASPNYGARISQEEFKIGGGAAMFDGKGSYYNLADFSPVEGDGARSVSLWVRGKTPSGTKPNILFLGWGDVGTNARSRCDFGLENSNDAMLRLEFHNDAVVSTAQSVNFLDGAWRHLIFTYDGKEVRFYVDGEQYGAPQHHSLPLTTGTNALGTVIGTGIREAWAGEVRLKRWLNGFIDDVGIWDEPLTATDAALINGLGRISETDLRWLDPARELWRGKVGDSARINGRTWEKVNGLAGRPGVWLRTERENRAGSFIVLNDSGEGLRISLRWWESSVFRWSIVTCLGAVVVWSLAWTLARIRWRMQLRQMEAKERSEQERRRIAQDLHDELGSRLTDIMQLGDLATKQKLSAEELTAQFAAVAAKARDLVGAMDEVVWTANPVNDVLPRLADYLSTFMQSFLRPKGIASRIEIMDDLPVIPLDPKVRHNLLLAVKEALNNAVKYSGATEVWLRVHCDASELCVSIHDNGCGFDPATVCQGNGLMNLRERLAALGGTTEIQTRPGEGVKIQFKLPRDRAAGK